MAVAVETSPRGKETEERQPSFFERISRPDLKEIITPKTPWVSISMEVAVDQMPFTGGMGILEGDKLQQAEKSQVPFVVVTLAYSERWDQNIEHFTQSELSESLTPEDLGLEKVGKVQVRANNDTIDLDVCRQQGGNVGVVALYEPGLRELYYGSNASEHRLYQQVVLGFGGQKALDLPTLGFLPSVIHLNESAKVFSAVAFLDKLIKEGASFEEALAKTRQKTILTNHTLVPAATSVFSADLFGRYVFPNVESSEVRYWIEGMLDKRGGNLDLSILAFELAGRYNGVSKTHSQIASGEFKRFDGSQVNFEPITNGIFLDRWVDPGYLALYQQSQVIDQFDLPSQNYLEKVDGLETLELARIKADAKLKLNQYLERRVDQYGKPIQIPQDAKIAVWARRFAGYKRPWMLFERSEMLASILADEDMHLIIAGKAHPTDVQMKEEMRRILTLIDASPALRNRVHFVQNYDKELAQHLVSGSDIWLNTPQVGMAACETSPFKAIGNLTRVISTRDGGLADVDPPTYLEIKGEDYQEEVDSLYFRLRQAAAENDHQEMWAAAVRRQLKAYLPIISGGRMLRQYIDFVFPPKDTFQAKAA